jgi:DNA-binding beta-propeller fold protein YncE
MHCLQVAWVAFVLFVPCVPAFGAPAAAVIEVEQVGALQGPEANPMSQPTDLAVAPGGTVWVLDGVNTRLAAFSRDRRFERYVGLRGFPTDARLPVGLGIESSGRLLVGDRDRGAIQVLTAEGALATTIPIPIDPGEQLADPTDVAPSATGKSYWVADNDNHCVKEIDAAGRLLRRLGRRGSGPGEMYYPATLALAPDGALAVADVLNARVDRFDAAGKPIAPLGSRGVLPGTFYRPKGVAVDRAGRCYVTDSFTGAVQVFAADGRFAGIWGKGGKPLRLNSPTSIVIDDAGLVYVVEMLASTVSIWREHGR